MNHLKFIRLILLCFIITAAMICITTASVSADDSARLGVVPTYTIDADGWHDEALNDPGVGTWDPTTMTATLTQDIDAAIVIEADGITLDGNYHTITGENSIDEDDIWDDNQTGINIYSKSDVTIKNINITDFYKGINLQYSSNITIEYNNIYNNGIYGINVDGGSCNDIINNTFYSNVYGIYIDSQNYLIDNNDISDSHGIFDSGSDYSQISNNTIHGHNNDSVVGSLGIYLLGTDNCVVLNNAIDNCRYGIYDGGCTNTNITENTMEYCTWGMYITRSESDFLRDNSMNYNTFNFFLTGGEEGTTTWVHDIDTTNTVDGKPIIYWVDKHDDTIDSTSDPGCVYLVNCSNITVRDLVLRNNWCGISLVDTSFSIIDSITAYDIADKGIYLLRSHDNCIQNCYMCAYSNFGHAIEIYGGPSCIGNNQVDNNVIIDNCVAVAIQRSDDNVLTNNWLESNYCGVAIPNGENNWIYNNNFIDNTTQAYGSNGNWFNMAKIIDDKPVGGNYWSDWTTPNEDDDMRFVDTAYIKNINEYQFQDDYPWAYPNGWLDDYEAPVTTITLSGTPSPEYPKLYTSWVNVTLNAADNIGVARTEYRLNDGTWIEYNGPFNIRHEGTNEIFYRSIDISGNVERTKGTTFYIDTLPPETGVEFSGIRQDDIYISPVEVTLLPEDDGIGIASTRYSVSEDSSFPINDDNWQEYSGPFTIDSPGSFTIKYYSIDNLGRIEGEKSSALTIEDITPPVTEVVVTGREGLNGWYQSVEKVMLYASDDFPGTIYTYIVQNGSPSIFKYYEINGDGSYKLTYYSIDAAGNEERHKTSEINVDSTPPLSEISVDENNVVTLTAKDETSEVASIEYRFDDETIWNTYTGPFPVMSDKDTTIYYRSTDKAGNVEEAQSEIITTTTTPGDEIPPVTTILLAGTLGDNGWYTSNVEATLTASDEGGEVDITAYSFDNSAWTTYTEAIIISNEGETTLYYRSNDAAGNVETTKSEIIKIDKTAPVTTAEADYTDPSSVKLTLSRADDVSGVFAAYYSLDYGSSWQTYEGELVFTNPGTGTVYYYSVDYAGNTEIQQCINIEVSAPPEDNTAPVTSISLTGTPGDNDWYRSVVGATLTATDEGGSGVDYTEYSFDGSSWQTYSSGIIVNEEGPSTLYYRSTDNAGNTEEYKTADLQIDYTDPVIKITSPAQFDVLPEGTPLQLEVTDEISGVAETTCELDDGTLLINGDPLPAGVHTLTVTAFDIAGNSSAKEIFNFVIYEPDGGFVTGGGCIESPAGAYAADPKLSGLANFGFVSKYKKGADLPSGQTEFQFQTADLNFHSGSYDWLIVAGSRAQFKGTGTINGTGEYGFMLTAIDGDIKGDGIDKFRIKIWDRINDTIIYDNQMDADNNAEPSTALLEGSIVIHKK